MTQASIKTVRWTSADLELLAADEWKRYEIIDGELFVTRAPHWQHQRAITNLCLELQLWSRANGAGEAITTPGIIFTEADNVIPDIVWVSHAKLATLLDEDGHLTGAPELIVEVLSEGTTNARRDRQAKLKLYSAQGVQEYWIVDWRLQRIEIYRRRSGPIATYGYITNNRSTHIPPTDWV